LLVDVLLINPGYGVPVHAVRALRRLLGACGPDEHTGLLLADGSVPEERAVSTKMTGTKLPHLKPWVKGVFATYVVVTHVVVTVPMLALLLFNLITRLPDIIRIAWSSLQNQAADLSRAVSGGDLVRAALSVAQMQMLGITYLLYRLGRMVIRMILKRAARRSANEGV